MNKAFSLNGQGYRCKPPSRLGYSETFLKCIRNPVSNALEAWHALLVTL